jgi:hypothetical protein
MPLRHAAILVNGKEKRRNLMFHYTSKSESSDPPSYVIPVCSDTPAFPRSEFNAGDPNGKKETLGFGPQPCHPLASSLYPPLPPMTPK